MKEIVERVRTYVGNAAKGIKPDKVELAIAFAIGVFLGAVAF